MLVEVAGAKTCKSYCHRGYSGFAPLTVLNGSQKEIIEKKIQIVKQFHDKWEYFNSFIYPIVSLHLAEATLATPC